MKRILYDSRAVPLDVLFKLACEPRGMFGEPPLELVDVRDTPARSEDAAEVETVLDR